MSGLSEPSASLMFFCVSPCSSAMIIAEEQGLTQKNISEALGSDNPDIKKFEGTQGNYGEQLGLTKDWAGRIVKHVGNYGEVFERNVGQGSPLKIQRGLNALWTKGGIQYAPPLRPIAALAGGAPPPPR